MIVELSGNRNRTTKGIPKSRTQRQAGAKLARRKAFSSLQTKRSSGKQGWQAQAPVASLLQLLLLPIDCQEKTLCKGGERKIYIRESQTGRT